MRNNLIPTKDTIYRWIETIHAKGIRRPGYLADNWAVAYAVDLFHKLGLENVHLEPVALPYWEPRNWSLEVTGQNGSTEIPCFPLPHSAPTDEIQLELVAYDPASPGAVQGKAALDDVRMMRIPPAEPVTGGEAITAAFDAAPMDVSPGGVILDPRGTFEGAEQVLPFGSKFHWVMEPAMAAGAAAWIGALTNYPGDSYRYYVPYDAVERPIPGLWIRGSDGARLRAMLDRGPVRIRLHVDSVREEIQSNNVVAELPGADDETVIIGSHHDGPWSSAVEDASGMAMVFAQAAYWSKVPAGQRPHRLEFLLSAGHMAGGAGAHAFVEAHADRLDRIVLEVHLEHAAREFVEKDGKLTPTGEPEPRWFFTSRIARLEAAVVEALDAEKLDRALIIAPDVFGDQPTADGGAFHPAGVPLVNYLTAPFYLFDPIDTLDKVHAPSLVPVTRAMIRLIESTAGISAAAMRSGAR